MTKKMISWLSVLAVFLTVLWSCHNEDFAKSESEPQRNNANFFKHTKKGGINAKSGVDYVSILEAYNREKDFLSTMPDQQGMPIWDKMQIVDAENATGLMIPLSHDNESMSSVLFAILDDKNSVTGVKDYDNNMLKNVVHNTTVNKEFRERMLYTFMYMDNRAFGNEKFTSIPEGLFDDLKYNKEYGRIEIKNFDEPKNATLNETGKILWVESCGMYWKCSHHGEGSCDYCMDKCHVQLCFSSMVFIEDGGYYPDASSGSSGGGGGATPSPEGIPPIDPCTQSGMPFYRMSPQCAGGGGNIDIPIDNPCEKLANDLDKLNAIIAKPKFVGRLNEISNNILTNWQEKAFSFGTSTANANEEAVTPVKTGDNLSGAVNIAVAYSGVNVQGGIHTHPKKDAEYKSFSFKDVFVFGQGNKLNSSFKYYLVKSYDGTVYALTIIDQTAFTTFFNNNDISYYLNAENSFDITTDIGSDIRNVIQDFQRKGKTKDEGYEAGLAFVMKKYNMGMAISKKDNNGNFIPIFVNELSDPIKPKKKTYEQTNDCNL